ncbi:MAG: hypothetical protein B1H03_01250 [Planctomycetales bacterium 4484_113]|nr:MAG: hypothetical protein B1H03_01250 [Planctomycetales bacterium 4484_113]
MKEGILKLAGIALLMAAILTVGATVPARALSEARVLSPDWHNGETFTYAIYQPAVGRIATAYYRLLTGEYEGRPIYKIVYNGKGGGLAESSTAIVDAVTLEPYKSVRKIKSAKQVFYIDTSYGDGRILVRRKQGEEGQIQETSIDFPGRIFDYEEMMWLIPQLDFSNDDRVHLTLFSTIGDQTILVVVRNMGEDAFKFNNQKFTATKYTFNLNLITQTIWVQEIGGRRLAVKYDTGENILYNLEALKPGAAVVAPPAPEKKVEKPKPPEQPKEEAKPKKEGEGEHKVYF